MNRCDILVVGAGTVGCRLASSLVQTHGFRVTLCELESAIAPEADRRRPARWLRLLGSSEDSQYLTERESLLAGRSLSWPRGRGLGGSSRINAMIWHDPTPDDLKRLVAASGGRIAAPRILDAIRQVEAEVQPEEPSWLSDTGKAFMESAQPFAADCGGSPMVYRRFNRNGARWDASQFLESVDREKLCVVRGSVASIFWDGDRAAGVRLVTAMGEDLIHSERGVVLCAGSIGTPLVLTASGIGSRDAMERTGVERRVDSPLVGRQLQDHLIMPVVFSVPSRFAFPDVSSVRVVCRHQVTFRGPLSSNIAECGGLFDQGNLQIHATPTHYLKYPATNEPAMTIGVNVTQPQSRGHLEFVPEAAMLRPRIVANYLSHEDDLRKLVRGVELARELAAQMPLAEIIERELLPGTRRVDVTEIEKSIRRYSQTLYHPVSTCAMSSDSGGVVDGQFRVRGTDRLWAVDASVLPSVTCGNPSVALLALGQIASGEIAIEVA